MIDADTLVVGASVAGVRCARALRAASYPGIIVLADTETAAPYDKPPLTKKFLDPGSPLPTLATAEALAASGIDFRPGWSATALDVVARTVHFGDDAVHFKNLVIATGARPRLLPVLNRPELPVSAIRTAASALAVRAALRPGAVIAIVGAGFLGLEVAASAARRGATAHVIELGGGVLGRGLAPEAAEVVAELHRHRGTVLHLGCSITAAEPGGRGAVLQLSRGGRLDVDHVLVAVGAMPSVDWLIDSTLTVTIADGVECDVTLQAAANVYAVGDCANWPNARYGQRMRLEHWTAAGEQATFVAQRIASGHPGECGLVPYVWSDQFDSRLQIVGLRGDTTSELRTASGDRVFVECDHGDVVGVAAIDQPRLVLTARGALVGGGRPLDEVFPSSDYERVG